MLCRTLDTQRKALEHVEDLSPGDRKNIQCLSLMRGLTSLLRELCFGLRDLRLSVLTWQNKSGCIDRREGAISGVSIGITGFGTFQGRAVR